MLHTPSLHFTDFFTPSFISSFKPRPHPHLPYGYSRVLHKTAVGRRDATSLERTSYAYPAADMNDMNPQAMPFQPGGVGNDPRLWNRSRNEHHPPSMPPFGFQGAPWNQGFPPPPPPPQFHPGNQYGYSHFEGFGQAQAHEQARPRYNQWAPAHGHPGPQAHFQPYGPPPVFPPQQYPPHFQQQYRPHPPPPVYPHPAHHSTMPQPNWPQGATNEDIQYAFTALMQGMRSKKRGADSDDSAPAQPSKKNKKSKAKAKAVADGLEEQHEYDSREWMDSFEWSSSRIDKQHSSISQPTKASKKGRYGDEKIMLPAPQPTDLYRDTASEEPTVIDPAGHVLVILDLNGTVLYRPNRNAKTMIARPYLKPFLQYLFQNFKVMVWSSARPENVKSLVDQALDKDLRSMLVATWARDTFGLSSKYYSQNVQVYKNLRLVWSRDQIQQHHPEYEAGGRFGQHNTVLIDDSALKASAQPYNLLEIPEFEATPEQMHGDVLREVAGYLDILRQQGDISKFINKQPFMADGRWSHDWPDESAGGGDLEGKITLNDKNLSPAAAAPAGKKGKGSRKSKSPAPANANNRMGSQSRGPSPAAPVTVVTDSLSSVSLHAAQTQG